MDRTLTLRELKIERVEHLSETALSAIGLMNIGVTEFTRIARLLSYVSVARQEKLLDIIVELQDSVNPLVRRWVDHGLPAGVSGLLADEQSVTCPLCKSKITRVPCISCGVMK